MQGTADGPSHLPSSTTAAPPEQTANEAEEDLLGIGGKDKESTDVADLDPLSGETGQATFEIGGVSQDAAVAAGKTGMHYSV